MASNAQMRPEPGAIPDAPGVYRFRDSSGRVIYVGKAKSLRSRLSSYFQDPAGLHPRTRTMVATAADVDWTVVAGEVEALQLEYSWIKEYSPRFNVRYRDDKSYPYLAVTLDEDYPRVQVMRGARRKGVRYFGPYPQVWAIRETVDLLLRAFPVRTCSAGVFKRARSSGRPCLLGYIDKCAAPCTGRISAEDHRRLAEDFCAFLTGDTGRYLRGLEEQMRTAAADMDYERAAKLRDDLAALRTAMEKQSVVLGDATDADVVALACEPLEAAVQVFYVRGGRVRGQRGWVVDRVDDAEAGDLMERFLQQLYGGIDGTAALPPREVLVSAAPEDPDAVGEWLAGLRGGRVQVRVPRRGAKAQLMETVAKNAEQTLARHKSKRSGDLTTRSQALNEVAEALGLDEAPLRIECYDVSELQGSNVVGSMVVFEDGLARKSEYRRFSVRGLKGTGDVAALSEVLTRRFRRYLEEGRTAGELVGASDTEGPEQAPAKFAYPPNLVVVDGGRPQVQAARRALDELGIDDIAVCGLAKRLEEVWLPGEEDPVVLARSSEGLYLLQRVRDEAHRFAITYHRGRRGAAAAGSALDGVEGVGPARRAALLKHFGSLRRLSQASTQEIAAVPGIGTATAQAILRRLGRAEEHNGQVDEPGSGNEQH